MPIIPVKRSTVVFHAYWALQWRTSFLLIFQNWEVYQASNMHIRQLNNKVLGKYAIKKMGAIFKRQSLKIIVIKLYLGHISGTPEGFISAGL